MFMDGDDWILPETIEAMAMKAEANNADLATVNMQSFSDETGETLKECVMPEMEDVVLDLSPADFKTIRPIYGKQLTLFGANSFYRVQIIRQYALHFAPTKQVLSEDQLFNFCYYAVMRRAVFVTAPMYRYRIRSSSLSHEQKPVDILNRRITWVHCLEAFLKTHRLPRQNSAFYTSICWPFFTDGCVALGSPERIIEGIHAIEQDNQKLYRKMLRHMLCGKAGRDYIRQYEMSPRAALYFRFMILLLLFGKNRRPAETYLSHK